MAYADPPFNTGSDQTRRTLAITGRDRRRRPHRLRRAPLRHARCSSESSYRDAFDDYLGFLEPRLREVRRVLAPRRARCTCTSTTARRTTAKLLLDELFGRECFLNELIWAYDYGAKPRRRWPQKHDTILVYVKRPRRATTSTPRRSTASPTWRPASSRPSSASAASARRASCGTRSSPPPGARRPATRRRSRRALVRRFVQASSRARRPVPGPVRRLRHARRRRAASSAAATC